MTEKLPPKIEERAEILVNGLWCGDLSLAAARPRLRDLILDAMRLAREKEREACARICDEDGDDISTERIRARGKD